MIAVVVVMIACAVPRPLTLKEATEIAVGAAPGVARAKIEQERARLQSVRAELEQVRATVDANIQALYVKPDVLSPDFGGVLALSNLSGAVDAPLFTGWRITADIARADHLEKAAAFDLESERRSVALAVARAYWSERRLALLERTQDASDARLADSERVVLARVNAGLSAGLDVNRAASRRVQLDVEKQSLQSQRKEATVRLAGVLGIDEAVELVDAPPALGDTLAGEDSFVQRALDARPELKAAELRGAAVDEEKRAAESAFWPQLDAAALVQVGNNPAIAGAGSHAVSQSILPIAGVQAGLTLSINLFDTYATTHSIEDAAHRRRLAGEELRDLRRSVESDVRLAHAHVVSLRDQRAVLVRARDLETDNVKILNGAYERGEVLLTELLDAQGTLASAERQIVDVDAQMALALVELEAAVGETK